MKLSKQFPLNALRVFEAVARLGSFTKAGEELGMTQTAVSYQVKLLEESIGEPLFLRRPRQISLTDTGERLAPRVTEGFAILSEAVASVSAAAEEMLLIHSTPTFAAQWLARHIGSFHLKYPSTAVRLKTSDTLIDFSRKSADLALRSGKGNWPGLRSHMLMKVTFTPMLAPALAEFDRRHPFTGRPAEAAADRCRRPLVAPVVHRGRRTKPRSCRSSPLKARRPVL